MERSTAANIAILVGASSVGYWQREFFMDRAEQQAYAATVGKDSFPYRLKSTEMMLDYAVTGVGILLLTAGLLQKVKLYEERVRRGR